MLRKTPSGSKNSRSLFPSQNPMRPLVFPIKRFRNVRNIYWKVKIAKIVNHVTFYSHLATTSSARQHSATQRLSGKLADHSCIKREGSGDEVAFVQKLKPLMSFWLGWAYVIYLTNFRASIILTGPVAFWTWSSANYTYRREVIQILDRAHEIEEGIRSIILHTCIIRRPNPTHIELIYCSFNTLG